VNGLRALGTDRPPTWSSSVKLGFVGLVSGGESTARRPAIDVATGQTQFASLSQLGRGRPDSTPLIVLLLAGAGTVAIRSRHRSLMLRPMGTADVA
jgi:hypothetical protein